MNEPISLDPQSATRWKPSTDLQWLLGLKRVGWLSLDDQKLAAWTSGLFLRMIEHSDLSLVDRQLRCETGAQDQLDQVVDAAIANQLSTDDATLLFGTGAADPMVVKVMSVTNTMHQRHAILLGRRVGLPLENPLPLLQERFRLTNREALLAAHLSTGASTADFRVAHQLGQETVKSHLKQIYRKTGCASQLQLVVLVSHLFS